MCSIEFKKLLPAYSPETLLHTLSLLHSSAVMGIGRRHPSALVWVACQKTRRTVYGPTGHPTCNTPYRTTIGSLLKYRRNFGGIYFSQFAAN